MHKILKESGLRLLNYTLWDEPKGGEKITWSQNAKFMTITILSKVTKHIFDGMNFFDTVGGH